MTNQQINAAIAEACGWREITNCTCGGKKRGCPPGAHSFSHTPDYCNDLNAMHEAEKHIYNHNNMWSAYYYEISAGPFSLHATARKKAEAFLRTLGKWEEVQK
jgi:hypothetical protein